MTVSQGKVGARNRCGRKVKTYVNDLYTLGNKCTNNCCKRTILVQLIVEDVLTWFLRHSVNASPVYSMQSRPVRRIKRRKSLGFTINWTLMQLFRTVSTDVIKERHCFFDISDTQLIPATIGTAVVKAPKSTHITPILKSLQGRRSPMCR